MQLNEFKVLVKGMKAVYPQSWFLPDADSVKIWFQLLKDLDYQVANVAVQKYILTNKKEPTIADIREYASTVTVGALPEWSDGWEQVLRAIRKYGMYNEAAALDSLDDITRTCTERLGFRNICMSENIATDRANFRMIYEQIANRVIADRRTPLELQKAINLMLESNKSNNLLEGGANNES